MRSVTSATEGAAKDERRKKEEPNTPKVSLVRYDADAVDAVVAAILFTGSKMAKQEVMGRVSGLTDLEKAEIVRGMWACAATGGINRGVVLSMPALNLICSSISGNIAIYNATGS